MLTPVNSGTLSRPPPSHSQSLHFYEFSPLACHLQKDVSAEGVRNSTVKQNSPCPCLFFHSPTWQCCPGVQISYLLPHPPKSKQGPKSLNFAWDFASQPHICLHLKNDSDLVLISRAGGQLEFPSSLCVTVSCLCCSLSSQAYFIGKKRNKHCTTPGQLAAALTHASSVCVGKAEGNALL